MLITMLSIIVDDIIFTQVIVMSYYDNILRQ